jgi:DUF4097 and DUF4098 domain-containing protein YvlB
MRRALTTTEPVDLVVEIQSGSLTVAAADTTETVVGVEGAGAEDVEVTQSGTSVRVIGPRGRDGLFRRSPSYDVTVVLPTRSRATLTTGSADIRVDGRLGELYARTGSGSITVDDVTESASLVTGSGDVRVERSAAPLNAVSGSGDVVVGEALAGLRVKIGSGTITVGSTGGGVSASTGSGDIRIHALAAGEARLRTGSGDAWVGVPAGLPVWTDVQAVGGVTSTLTSRGAPEEGQPYLSLRARVGSGTVHLEQV